MDDCTRMDDATRIWFRKEAEQARAEMQGDLPEWYEIVPCPMSRFGSPMEIRLPLSWSDVTEDDAE
jgi:hypothetical protein